MVAGWHHVAFVRRPAGEYDLYLANADGSGVRPLIATPRPGTSQTGRDGHALAYASGNRLVVVQLADGSQRRLMAAGSTIRNLTWSPDGKRIAFSIERADGTASVLIRLTWPDGRRSSPRVDLLRRCEGAERC